MQEWRFQLEFRRTGYPVRTGLAAGSRLRPPRCLHGWSVLSGVEEFGASGSLRLAQTLAGGE